jgi:rfaE bifunctional protein kinase chain/domain
MISKELTQKSREFLKKSYSQRADILVLGDVAIDRFVFGSVDRISPEAPVPILHIDKTVDQLGCTANVVRNLAALGDLFPNLNVHLLSLVGKDDLAKVMKTKLQELGAKVHVAFQEDSERPTILKTRFLAGSHHQLLRADLEVTRALATRTEQALMDLVDSKLSQVSYVILQDYAKGLFSMKLCQQLIQSAQDRKVRVIVDPHRNSDPQFYRGAWMITPNVAEAEVLVGRNLFKGSENALIENAAREIKEKLNIEMVMITRSHHGLTLLDSDNKIHHYPTMARAVYDVTGAGDTLVSILVAALAMGANLDLASVLANAAAAVVVGKVGTATATPQEIDNELDLHIVNGIR